MLLASLALANLLDFILQQRQTVTAVDTRIVAMTNHTMLNVQAPTDLPNTWGLLSSGGPLIGVYRYSPATVSLSAQLIACILPPC
jgi:hypothetical protein